MTRGKIEIKKIENMTNRQVTYSKRRSGLFKKANELTVLCDATVSILMLSSTDKLHEFLSPAGVTTKEIYDRYQKMMDVDLWETHYKKMQDDLQRLNEINRDLQRDIRQRMGDCLEDLTFDELHNLGNEVGNALNIIRERKCKWITTQIDTTRKKVRNVQQINRGLLQEFDIPRDEPQYGLVDDGDYNHMIGYHGGSHVLALRLQPFQPSFQATGVQPDAGGGAVVGTGAGSGSCVTTYTLL